MTDQEITKLYAEAKAEWDAGSEEMILSPLLIIGVIERLSRCEEAREAAGAYDQLHS